ncbi:MAG: hypothetical protein ACPGED_11850, partial [Flavobacteriales bacterium]
MLKRLVLLSFFFAFAMVAFCQIGNEWINYGQQYWRMNISESGPRTLTFEDFQQAGMPLQGSPIDDLRVMANGEQVNVQVADNGDGIFNSGDAVLVNLDKNNGWLDAQLYQSPEDQNNPDYSLFNDTARVYVTLQGSDLPLRTNVYESSSNIDLLPNLNFVLTESRLEFTSNYFFGIQDQNGIALPWYQEGEGWFDFDKNYEFRIIPRPLNIEAIEDRTKIPFDPTNLLRKVANIKCSGNLQEGKPHCRPQLRAPKDIINDIKN